ncbi:hypothetical protein [Roseomonas elaeocarpi]|uniref:DUF5666 domain-containing protein n=1 Tax=Roseomonas elaeocarpi TaxID=907779 RepID=A0ABV6JM52_9PROT
MTTPDNTPRGTAGPASPSRRFRFTLLAGALLLSAGGVALAQNASLYDPAQLPATKGRVAQYSLTPRGDVDGLILEDGTEVHLPPHLGTQLVFAVKPGDAVTVRGLRARSVPMVQAMQVTNDASNVSVTDMGPPGGPPPRGPEAGPMGGPGGGPGGGPEGGPGAGPDHGPGFRAGRGPDGRGPGRPHDGPPPGPMGGPMGGPGMGGTPIEATGRVKLQLHGPRGDLNGAVLEDGTIIRLPPPEAQRLAARLAVGQTLFVRGEGLSNPLGKVIAARALGTSAADAVELAPPPRGPHGPDRGPDRGPEGAQNRSPRPDAPPPAGTPNTSAPNTGAPNTGTATPAR